MYSLFYVLTNQHEEEFAPVRCNEETVLRLVRYFEDIVTENKLSALVIESRPVDSNTSREAERVSRLSSIARHLYFFCDDQDCENRFESAKYPNLTVLGEPQHQVIETGPFILVMEPRFSGLLASCAIPEEGNGQAKTYEMIWTFDPNVVFTAIEYLMARVNAQKPEERAGFESLLNTCAPRSTPLRLALTFTTKLAMLMQRQNELEMATNRISSAISTSLEIDSILQSAVEEVGRALKARRATLVLWQEGSARPESMRVYERADNTASVTNDKEEMCAGSLEIPIVYRNTIIGVLAVEDDSAGRIWEDEEVLMVRTVSDQLAVAISHARLFQQMQTQAMTDALTGLYNHRYFQEQMERETTLADRHGHEVSLILLDLDHLKRINDTFGHRAGDAALCHVARLMQSTVREVDICARYGGEEFVIIMPQCGREDAINVAERLREAIASKPLQTVGQVTASVGVATYPTAAGTKEDLVEMSDRAMYLAKAAGRNRVRTLMHRTYLGVET